LALACIDVGSNTTRLLVAEVERDSLRELEVDRAFTRIGRSVDAGGSIPPEKLAETGEVVAKQVGRARELGAEEVVVVGTAAIRRAPNGMELAAAVMERCGLPLRILSPAEEARLAFVGATRTFGSALEGVVAVVDVGGGSTEVATGIGADVTWSDSFDVGSGRLADAFFRSDPPARAELAAARRAAAGALEGLAVPPPDRAIAVGGSATSLRRVAGDRLERGALDEALDTLCTGGRAEVAERLDLDPERIRLLPAGIIVFQELIDRLGASLEIARGGLREGVVLERALRR
jgi:exopolyphosphatase / guanosine-5'-triphosphate,3'-diphosphate pyrophosphatase